MIPKSRISFLLAKLSLTFLVTSITKNIVKEATKNLKNTKVKGSTDFSPILIAGKEVPHKKPAKTVKNMAFFLFLAPT